MCLLSVGIRTVLCSVYTSMPFLGARKKVPGRFSSSTICLYAELICSHLCAGVWTDGNSSWQVQRCVNKIMPLVYRLCTGKCAQWPSFAECVPCGTSAFTLLLGLRRRADTQGKYFMANFQLHKTIADKLEAHIIHILLQQIELHKSHPCPSF
jgi:hypothetical protein